MMTTMRAAAISLLLVAGSATAAQTADPWMIPIQERIALRLDHQRAAAAGRRPSANSTADASTIDGAHNPSLFLPSELMSLFLSTLLGSDATRAAARVSYHDAIQSYGWQESQFWRDLDRGADGFYHLVELESAERDKTWEQKVCASRVRALRTMRSRYARFDEFLYHDVAPRHVVASGQPEDPNWLLWLEGGCQ